MYGSLQEHVFYALVSRSETETESNPNFGKVGRIESNQMQNESNRTEPNANS